jgi:hypothetical protein
MIKGENIPLFPQTIHITSKEELADFIETLRDDFIEHQAGWENTTLDQFLDAMAAWVRSMDNAYRNMGAEPPASPSWRLFANILAAAKIYE